MAEVHPLIASANRTQAPQALIAVVCAYECGATEAPAGTSSWARVLELARAGFQVWVVTPSAQRERIERALQTPDAAAVNVLFWDPPRALGVLARWRHSARLHALMWYWIVERAIAQWHAAVGMRVVRRVVQPTRTSVSFVLMPALARTQRSRFALRPLRD